MQITVLVPSRDEQLAQLPWLLLGLRQQALDPVNWSLLIVHCGSAEALEQALAEFRARIGDRLRIKTLVLPPETLPAQALAAAKNQLTCDLVLFLQPGYQPHRSLLEIHHRFHQQAAAPAVATGSSQFHPEQALSRFAMACQMDQLLFNFFPMPVQEVLPFTACHLHNLSLPLSLLPELDSGLQSWHFCGWDLGLRLWRQGLRLQGLHEARSCLVNPLNLDTALNQWLRDAQQDLAVFLLAQALPIPGLELDWPRSEADLPAPAALEQLHQSLRQSQAEISIPIERGDAAEQALQTWKGLLHQLWRGKALQGLLQDVRRPEQPHSLYPLPWRSGDRSETGAQPEQIPGLTFMRDGPFDALLRAFLQLEDNLPPRGLLALQLSPTLRQLHRLILENYSWIELGRHEEVALLCKLGPRQPAADA